MLAALDDRLGPRPDGGGPARPATVEAAPGPVTAIPGAGPPAATHGPARPPAPEPAPAAPPSRPAPARAPEPARAPVPALEVEIGSALPFLVLVPLARTGWLDTLAVAVEATGLGGHWPALAAALAYKVLSPPEHGWHRSPEDQTTAAAFAGAREPLVQAALPARTGLLAPPLDAVLARSLVDGHRPDAPLVLVRAPRATGWSCSTARACSPWPGPTTKPA